jgi:uncharacterized membrane protein
VLKRAQEPETQRALLQFFLPWALMGIGLTLLATLGPDVYVRALSILGLYVFTPLGKSLGVTIGIDFFTAGGAGIAGLGWGAWEAMAAVILLILFADACISMFIVWNMDHARGIPVIGWALRAAETAARGALARSARLRKMAFAGLLLFTIVPLYGTGPIVTPVMGRMMGLTSVATWIAVVLGSAIRSTLLGLATLGVLRAVGVA